MDDKEREETTFGQQQLTQLRKKKLKQVPKNLSNDSE